jgi:starch-binding outer membrane protein, SusD/RagB family
MKKSLLLIALFSGIFVSCEDDLDLENKEYASREQIEKLAESSPESLLVITTGIEDGTNSYLRSYNTYGGGAHSDFGMKAIDLGLDLMSNDMVQVRSHWFSEYYNYTGRQQSNARATSTVWNFYYKVIRDANSIIELTPSNTENEGLKSTAGRALALRGMAYFNLIRLYGNGDQGIPLYTETEEILSRASTSQVVAQIKSDLETAYTSLAGFSRTNKTQIDQNVVAGLLARFYLTYGEYAKAIQMAEQAQTAGSLMNADQIYDGFDEISNPSWIWGADITPETSSIYASFFSHVGNLNPGYAGLLGVYKSVDARLFDNISDTDARKDWFVTDETSEHYGLPKYANVKFIDDTFFEGDYVYMRVEEMYLIEAEAQALSGDDQAAAQTLLELVSKRDSGYTLSANTGDALLEEIREQRSLELWGEGFAFYDMKRWEEALVREYAGSNHASFGRVDYSANSSKFIFQIPLAELNANDQIGPGDQNPF